MKTKILDLIDFKKVDTLLEGFNKSTGFVTAILDLEGNVLSKSGWRQICTEFHRVNPETSKKCTISDTVLSGKMEEGEKYHFYKCLNGLVDVAVPIVIKGEHIANLFSGQFFFEEPDSSFFKEQADKYGFNQEIYLKALGKVPVVSKEKVLVAMDFLLNMTQLISDMTFQKLEQMELNETIRKSEARFRSIFENNLATMLIIEPSTRRIVDANYAAERFYGWSRSQLSQMTIDQINTLPPDELQKEMELARSQKRIYFKFKHRTADGSARDVEIYSSKVEIDGKEYLQSIVHDITEQIKAENAIKRSDQIFRLFVEHSPASIAMFDNNMRYMVASRRFLLDYNLGDQDIIGRSHYEVFPEISERWKEIHRRCLAGETISESNDPFPRADGSTDWVRWEIRPWCESENQIGGIILFSEVITSQIEGREALKESEKYNRMLFEQSAIGLALTSFDGRLVDINTTFATIIGRTVKEAKALTYWDITPEKYENQEQQQLDLLAKTGRYGPYEKEYIHKDRHLVPVRLQGLIIERYNEKFIWSSVEDISERKKAELELSRLFESEKAALIEANQAKEQLSQILERISDGFGSLDRDWNYTYVNKELAQNVGKKREELVGRNIWKVFPQAIGTLVHKAYLRAMEEQVVIDLEHYYLPFERWFQHRFYPSPDGISVFSKDITEHKLAEEKIKENSSLIRIAAEKAKLGGWNVDLKENRSYWSDEVAAIHELPPGYAPLVEDGINFYAPEWHARITQVFTNCALNGTPYDEEMEIITSTGKRVWVRTIGEAVRDENGNIYKVEGAFQDITENKRADEAIRKAHDQLTKIILTSPSIICSAHLQSDGTVCFPFGGERLAEYYGIPEANLAHDSSPYAALIHPDDNENMYASIMESAKQLSPWRCEYRMVHPVKGVLWIEGHSMPHRETDGSTLWHGVVTDITERKRSEEILKENNSRLELAMKSANMAWWEIDITTGNVIFDRRKSEMLGYPAEKFKHYKDFVALVHPEDVDKTMKAMQKHIDGLVDKYELEYRILTQSGEYKWFYDIGTIVKKDTHGKPLNITGLVIDITERKLAEENIHQLNEELEQRVLDRTAQLEAANKELETFTYSVSHDLKAPLRGIDGYSKLLSDLCANELNDEAKHFISTIRKSTQLMSQLIDDLLQYSRLERSQLRSEPVLIKPFVDAILKINEDEIISHLFSVITDIPETAIIADYNGIQMALRNLIENAIKFTKTVPDPSIEIKQEESERCWTISMKDNGIGFDMKYSHRIFEIFQRLHRVEDYPGTGIGLAMVGKAMQRMNGRAWAESTPGLGATFYLEIPKPI